MRRQRERERVEKQSIVKQREREKKGKRRIPHFITLHPFSLYDLM